MSDQVELRPVREDDLPVLERVTQDPAAAGEFSWFGWIDPQRWRRGWTDNRLLSESGGALMAVRGEEVLGAVNWYREAVAPSAHYWAIGIAMLPETRGHGYGTQAHRLLVRYLFTHTPVHRIEAVTDAGNTAEQRALEKAGFTREGVSRGACWRAGAWRDAVTYSLLRTDERP